MTTDRSEITRLQHETRDGKTEWYKLLDKKEKDHEYWLEYTNSDGKTTITIPLDGGTIARNKITAAFIPSGVMYADKLIDKWKKKAGSKDNGARMPRLIDLAAARFMAIAGWRGMDNKRRVDKRFIRAVVKLFSERYKAEDMISSLGLIDYGHSFEHWADSRRTVIRWSKGYEK